MTLMQSLREGSWWLDSLPELPESPDTLPGQADVVIIGAGYTGLNAAIELARGGRDVTVVEAGHPGKGCSSRNGGQIGPGIKPSFEKLARKYGPERAAAIQAEGSGAMDFIEARIKADKIDCDYNRCGLYLAAHTPTHYEGLSAWIKAETQKRGFKGWAVPRDEQHGELGSDAYYGGAVFADNGGLHPAKYVRGLLEVARKAGVTVVGQCEATGLRRSADDHVVETAQGVTRAGKVVVATNGYTGALTPGLRRRFMPISSSIIATEDLDASLIDRLFPKPRMICDTRKVIYYYRTSPDRKRVLFGGRVAPREMGAQDCAVRLRRKLGELFPELRSVGLTNSWSGTVSYTFDELPHLGQQGGVHYAMGYCGSGVAMSSYLGAKLGQQMLGKPEGQTAFDDLQFRTVPLYNGTPWFLPAVIGWHKWRDHRAIQAARKAQG